MRCVDQLLNVINTLHQCFCSRFGGHHSNVWLLSKEIKVCELGCKDCQCVFVYVYVRAYLFVCVHAHVCECTRTCIGIREGVIFSFRNLSVHSFHIP
jgi:hypothetical protein